MVGPVSGVGDPAKSPQRHSLGHRRTRSLRAGAHIDVKCWASGYVEHHLGWFLQFGHVSQYLYARHC